MKTILSVLVVMLARPFYVIADDTCVPQPDLRALVPYVISDPSGGLDPNATGSRLIDDVLANVYSILPPTSSMDPNLNYENDETWHVAVGKVLRVAPYCCKPNWVMTTVEYIDGTSRATVTFDTATKTWRLAAEVLPGLNWWFVHAVNEYALSQGHTADCSVFVTCWGELPDAETPRLF
jgi:hypothetical protein